MNIHYRILKVDVGAHSVLVRYFTDKVTELELASLFNEDGSVQLHADGYPLSTRTDVLISLYQTPTPSPEELDKLLMKSAPVDWLKLQEAIKDPAVDTKMKKIRNLVGDTKAFTEDDIKAVIDAEEKANETIPTSMQIDNLQKAYGVISGINDSVKIISEQDPSVLTDLANTLNVVAKSNSAS